jgi:hypothetical protein
MRRAVEVRKTVERHRERSRLRVMERCVVRGFREIKGREKRKDWMVSRKLVETREKAMRAWIAIY